MSAVGGRNDAVVTVWMEPFVFQRRENAAVRFVPGTLEMFFASSVMSLKSSRAGREFTSSSKCSAQFVTATLPTVPLHWFVLLSSIATALVTERRRKRIPPGAFAAGSDGLASSTTFTELSLARLTKSFAPFAVTEFTATSWQIGRA